MSDLTARLHDLQRHLEEEGDRYGAEVCCRAKQRIAELEAYPNKVNAAIKKLLTEEMKIVGNRIFDMFQNAAIYKATGQEHNIPQPTDEQYKELLRRFLANEIDPAETIYEIMDVVGRQQAQQEEE